MEAEGEAEAGHVVAKGVCVGDGDWLQGVALALRDAAALGDAEAEMLSQGEAMAWGEGEAEAPDPAGVGAATYPELSHQPYPTWQPTPQYPSVSPQ